MARRIVFPLILALLVLGVILIGLTPSHHTEELRWRNGEVELAGTLYLPAGAGPHPAAVFIQGAGGWTRDEPIFRVHAERLAREGLALLIYDKRGCGESSGDWRVASFEELAGDALGAVALLRGDDRIRTESVGLFATSQGSAVALLAVARTPEVAFLVTLSLSTLSPVAQAADLAARGVSLELEETPTSRDFDPLPLLHNLAIPLFAAQGADDELVPGPRAAATLTRLGREPGRNFTVVLVPGAEHTLRPWPGRYWRSLETWLDANVFAGR